MPPECPLQYHSRNYRQAPVLTHHTGSNSRRQLRPSHTRHMPDTVFVLSVPFFHLQRINFSKQFCEVDPLSTEAETDAEKFSWQVRKEVRWDSSSGQCG